MELFASKLFDAVDLVWRNRVGETYNINADLGRMSQALGPGPLDTDQAKGRTASPGFAPRASSRPLLVLAE